MTSCIAGPEKPIKGADHKHPAVHYRMAPGTAWKLTASGREEASISPAQAASAAYTFCLIWHSKGVAAVFDLDGQEYAQPTQAIKEERKPRERKTPPTTELIRPRQTSAPPDGAATASHDAPRRLKGRRRLKAPLTLWNS